MRRIVRVGVADDLHVGVRARRIRAPHFLAAVHVVRRHATAHAELTTRDARDHDVFDHDRRIRHGRASLVIGVRHAPQLLARLRIQRQQIAGEQLDEQLAARMVGDAAVHQIATGDRLRLGRLGRYMLPDHRCAFLRQVERKHDVRERAVHVHHRADDQRVPFMTVQNAGRERPGGLEVLHVRLVDLGKRAVTLQVGSPTRHRPLSRCALGDGGRRDEHHQARRESTGPQFESVHS